MLDRRLFTLGGLTAAIGATRAWAQEWPSKPIRMVLSQPPGSGVDTIARLLGEHLGKKWSQPVVVENKPGGQNVIGAQHAARSPADGYNFYFATAAALVSNRYLFKSLPYDPVADFVPVALVAKVPFALLVNPAMPVRNLQEFIASAKARPGKVSVGNEGPKTFGGIMARLFNARAGIDTNLISYVSVGASVTDTVGGQTDAIVCDVPSASAMVREGRLRPIAVTTAKRVAGWDDVAPLADTLPGFDFAGWFGIVAPAGTPNGAVRRFAAETSAYLGDKDVAARILAIGPIVESGGSPESFGAFMASEHERWGKLTTEIGLLPE
jgi:tripartite-type tricarboxylate transporter receptor subunit TctC